MALASLLLGYGVCFGGSQNYYEVLGVPETASVEEIQRAYRKVVIRFHPDRHPNPSEEERVALADKTSQINVARDVLLDPKRRAKYDSDLLRERKKASLFTFRRKASAGSMSSQGAKKFTDWPDFGKTEPPKRPPPNPQPQPKATPLEVPPSATSERTQLKPGIKHPQLKLYENSNCILNTLGSILDVHI